MQELEALLKTCPITEGMDGGRRIVHIHLPDGHVIEIVH